MLKSKKRKEYFTILLRGKVVLYDWFLHSANSQLHRIQNSFSFIIISNVYTYRERKEKKGKEKKRREK